MIFQCLKIEKCDHFFQSIDTNFSTPRKKTEIKVIPFFVAFREACQSDRNLDISATGMEEPASIPNFFHRELESDCADYDKLQKGKEKKNIKPYFEDFPINIANVLLAESMKKGIYWHNHSLQQTDFGSRLKIQPF